jgi:ribosomal protein S6--L-glutamate ligase
MKFALIKDPRDHPMLREVAAILAREHDVVAVDDPAGSAPAIVAAEVSAPADVYLCKSHSEQALQLAAELEAAGATVINSAASTSNAQDRVWMAAQLAQAGIPAPRTEFVPRLADLPEPSAPIVVKSRLSRRGDLVTQVDGRVGLSALMAAWSEEPVVVQRWIPNDGWDLKLWVVGRQIFAAHRPTPLDLADSVAAPLPAGTIRMNSSEVTAEVREMATAVGDAFGLEIYGVDVVGGARAAVVVDVNPFPGARGIAGFAAAVAALAQARAQRPMVKAS